jgi:hypothetical protein
MARATNEIFNDASKEVDDASCTIATSLELVGRVFT